jgi:LysR family glycine cleavage system transcriptional activator
MRLGVALFDRTAKELTLTRAGSILLRSTSSFLSNIKSAINEIESLSSLDITINASTAVASYFLVPYIHEFRNDHPQVSVRIQATEDTHGYGDGADFIIRYGDGKWSNTISIPVARESIFLVASAKYVAKHGINNIQDIEGKTFIEFESENLKTTSISQWLKAVGIGDIKRGGTVRVSNYDLAVRWAIQGEGITLAWEEAQPKELLTGELVRISDIELVTGKSEYLCHDASTWLSPAAQIFWEWSEKRLQTS